MRNGHLHKFVAELTKNHAQTLLSHYNIRFVSLGKQGGAGKYDETPPRTFIGRLRSCDHAFIHPTFSANLFLLICFLPQVYYLCFASFIRFLPIC